ncbi:protein phosphatase CheZ [Crenobacter cavernae]|uniref:Protein phosphatase CheZ n=1 Tax=Crenobacter cavernae TaxID=2290923 RepID=A0A345Y6W3_9NEIS|nr:protein phosphatase CheZ [Crenobacter cavernae]AXK39665.1 protein phosphatase CheZ [Crenobacter cavernae]
MSDHVLESGDSPELEALFNSIALQQQDTQHAAAPSSIAPQDAEDMQNSMYSQIGHLARKLHDAMRELGYDKSLERVAEAIPDAKDRLAYIATLTENAAERVLNATDIAKPLQDELEGRSKALAERWDHLHAGSLSVDEFKTLAEDTRQYLHYVPQQTQATGAQLLDIVMAQDFQDLTGQVIKKVTSMIKLLEGELLTFLIEHSPSDKRAELGSTSLLNGPVVNPAGRTDVVTDQQQVDELLESLGF